MCSAAASLDRLRTNTTLAYRPAFFDKDVGIVWRKVQQIAFLTIGNIDPVELFSQLLCEPHFHLRDGRTAIYMSRC